MSHKRVYVVLDLQANEKSLVQAIATQSGIKATRTTNASLLKSQDVPLAYYHWFMTKDSGLYLELQVNRGTDGSLQLPDWPDAPFVVRTHITDYFYARRTKDNADAVAAELDAKLRGLPFQLRLVDARASQSG